MKPITQGCLAYIIKAGAYPEHMWAQVVCEKYLGDTVCKKKTGPDKLVRNAWQVRFQNGRRMAAREEGLLRIDDPDIRKQLESEVNREVKLDIEVET